ncbi:hypothetical protein BS78_07G024900 [Paspalum vaginatum]|nr:hypothetical protein BS78_07G024900 [Paspalum vaginatum]KAJ1267022.1 hypothetical protein BS78_07G024900 [Paspalum vaginatum]
MAVVAATVSASMGVMKPILAKLTALVGDEYKKLRGLPEEVNFLKRELTDMDALLERMDGADELDPQAKNWRKDIIEMSYNIKDYIDDFMCHVGEPNDKVGILRKASQCLGSFKDHETDDKVGILPKASRYLRSFNDRRRLVNQFQEIKALVIETSERRRRYILDRCISITTPVVVDPRMSALYKDSTSLVGIDAQKDELANWAMDKWKPLTLMAIVGFGGLGKTTLANELYHEVGGKFHCKAFVSVSQKPEMIGLFNSLLLQFGLGIYPHACQVQDAINNIRGYLQDKRYLIIVDDLWDIKAWNTICCAFPHNNQHSKVVITTRIEGVAKACCGNHGSVHTMKPLSEADSRKLFFYRVFGSEDACPSELSKVSYEILKKCAGLPLAIVTMGSLLACQPTRLEGQWEYIQNSLASKFTTNSDYEDMMYILDLSYKNLPRHLKACFLHLGSYPEDHEIRRVDLVRQWVAEGFVSKSNGQDAWEVAESYFNELINRSMLQPIYREHITGLIFGCRVHDMLLELIARRCKEDNFLSLVSRPQAVAGAQDKVVRRLTVVGLRGRDNDGKVTKPIAGNFSQLRSLTILGSNWVPSLDEFKFLRVLFLNNFNGVMIVFDLSSINNLSHLKYLKGQGNIEMPSKIQGLRLLETLDLSGVSYYSVPSEIVDVPHLSHFLVPRGTWLPNWIGKVKSLRTLWGFDLPSDSFQSIISLAKLTALSQLSLYLPSKGVDMLLKATWMDHLSTSLNKLRNLKQLTLLCSQPFGSVALCVDDALSLLSPPFSNLELLDMTGCTFSRVPRWIIHLQNICRLTIGVKQILQEDVAIIGTRLPSLLRLSLRLTCIPMERIVIGGTTGFSTVKFFQFNCDGISYLAFEAGAMPKLQELELNFDPNKWDKAAPGGLQHLPSLKKIRAARSFDDRGYCWTHDKSEDALIKAVLQEAADALLTRPAFTLGQGWLPRPTYED